MEDKITTRTRDGVEDACLALQKIPDEEKPATVELAHKVLVDYLKDEIHQ